MYHQCGLHKVHLIALSRRRIHCRIPIQRLFLQLSDISIRNLIYHPEKLIYGLGEQFGAFVKNGKKELFCGVLLS